MSLTQVVTPYDGAQYFGVKAVQPKSKLDMDAFMRLLAVQLVNQNPLEPMNDRDFFAQMAQLGSVQGLDKMQKSLEVTQAAALIGKTVTAIRPMSQSPTATNDLVVGEVAGLVMKNGTQQLVIREANGGIVEIDFSAIQSISG
jgi:flagellar basal-body rod modification protein FlgD